MDDKPVGEHVRVLHKDDLKKLLEEAAQVGASKALAAVGLHDDKAYQDMIEMRSWLAAWRAAKSTAWRTFWGLVVKGFVVVVIVGVAVKFGWKIPD